MNTRIKGQIEGWKFIQNLAFDVLKMLPDEQLDFTVGKNMGTLGEQFRHIIRVRTQYTEAIENNKVADTIEKIDPNVARSKTKLLKLWEMANQRLLSVLENTDSEALEKKIIDWTHWGIESMNIHGHLNALMDHENLHNGQLIVYLRTMDLKFPKSWKSWGL
ncbi:MAG: DinB family protein [Candidatus Vogelbacteria bacterium]|nr:DinB family protein [Candidatus Vogelbacteria bacterium]